MENSEEENINENTQESTKNAEGNKTNPILIIAVVIIVIVIAVGVFLYKSKTDTKGEMMASTQDQMAEPSITQTVNTEQMTDNSMMSEESNSQIISVEGGNFYFKPNEIRVKVGEPVVINFTNNGGAHDFVIKELGVQSKLTQSGETAQVQFTPNQTGTFEFYCSVGNHRAMGMKGTLIVEE